MLRSLQEHVCMYHPAELIFLDQAKDIGCFILDVSYRMLRNLKVTAIKS